MISVEEALALVLSSAGRKQSITVAVSAALGLILDEDIAAEIDSPPWDKSMVDGYAIQAADLETGTGRFVLLEEVVAGAVATKAIMAGKTIRIMTGAPIPSGCDAVVMVEKSRLASAPNEPEIVELRDRPVAGQNILRKGIAVRQGTTVLASGQQIRPIEIGLLHELGRTSVRAIGRPAVAVLTTGNEIVPAGTQPRPGQIRNSNGPMLIAALESSGADAIDLGIARDEHDDLQRHIERGLEADVLVLSGGVSAGVLDLVPQVLTEAGVEQVFHKLRLKPGKPLWFGVGQRAGHKCLVFGLPGNPVSSLVCFELFVRPAIAALSGRVPAARRPIEARLVTGFQHRGDRPTYHPARLTETNAGFEVAPLRWQGSADLFGLSQANTLAHFPAGDFFYEAGSMVKVIELP